MSKTSAQTGPPQTNPGTQPSPMPLSETVKALFKEHHKRRVFEEVLKARGGLRSELPELIEQIANRLDGDHKKHCEKLSKKEKLVADLAVIRKAGLAEIATRAVMKKINDSSKTLDLSD